MATLLTIGNSEGTRRCDATCYDATGKRCDCVCGGKNHGVGKKAAEENTREMMGFSRDDVAFGEELRQLELHGLQEATT